MLRYTYTACLFYFSYVMFNVVFEEGWLLAASETFRPNFYKSTELHFSYFPIVEGSFLPGQDTALQSIRSPIVRSNVLLSSS
jgi:hypothetical protein